MSGTPVFPALVQANAAQDIYAASAARGAGEYFPMMSGQSVGLIRDLPGTGEVVHAIVRKAHAVLEALPQCAARVAPAIGPSDPANAR